MGSSITRASPSKRLFNHATSRPMPASVFGKERRRSPSASEAAEAEIPSALLQGEEGGLSESRTQWPTNDTGLRSPSGAKIRE